MNQLTIKEPFKVEGKGLHSGIIVIFAISAPEFIVITTVLQTYFYYIETY